MSRAGLVRRELRFSPPRIALDGDQPRLSRLHPGDDLRYPGEFCRPARENVEWRLRILQAPIYLARDVGKSPVIREQ
jgi:hypothetical protein